MLELHGVNLLQVLPHSQLDFSFQNIKFHEILAHQDVSSQHQRHNPIPLKFSATIEFKFFCEKIIRYSRTFAPQVLMSWNQAHAPLLIESFPKTPRTQSEASCFGGSHNYKTNYLPSSIDIVWSYPNTLASHLERAYSMYLKSRVAIIQIIGKICICKMQLAY
jgi:hypothetical protein